MLPLRFVRRWQIASAALLVLILVFMLMPAAWLDFGSRESADWLFDFDKWLHGATFTILAIWFSGQYSPRFYWRIAVGLILFGLLTEGCQRLVTYRSAELFDVGADAAGIVLGLTIALVGTGGWSLRVEHWFIDRKVSAES